MVSKYLRNIEAFVEEGGRKLPFSLQITESRREGQFEDYYCDVRVPRLLQEEKRIYGVDKAQAERLSLEFVRSILRGRVLFDNNGRTVDLLDQ